jgi:hypothetical protein
MHHMRMSELWVIRQRVRASLKVSRPGLRMTPRELYTILGSVLLDEAGVDRFIAEATEQLPGFVRRHQDAFLELASSTDLWPYLEYATTKGNAEDRLQFLNVRYLKERMSPQRSLHVRNTALGDDASVAAVVAYANRDCARLEALRGQLRTEDAAALAFTSDCKPPLTAALEGQP